MGEDRDAELDAFIGVGHYPADIKARDVHPGEWPQTPRTCTAGMLDTRWINDGMNLVCTGCGLDVT